MERLADFPIICRNLEFFLEEDMRRGTDQGWLISKSRVCLISSSFFIYVNDRLLFVVSVAARLTKCASEFGSRADQAPSYQLDKFTAELETYAIFDTAAI